MEAWQILLAALLYIGLLFGVAIAGDRHLDRAIPIPPALIYSLALAVYCTTWTYYGAVGRAASNGWDYLPIYLGPMLLFLFGRGLWTKLLLVAKRQNSSSIADFIASRYGKRRGIAILVTFIAMLAVVPYIALQLKAVTSSIEVITRSSLPAMSPDWLQDTTLLAAISMIVFAILFGTRQVDVTEHHRGLVMAIAFESLVKLIALLAVGVFVVWYFFDGPSDFFAKYQGIPEIQQLFTPRLEMNFFTQMLLAAGAILCLPRQFHIGVVENTDVQHLNTARWIFPLYLLLICLVVVPVTSAGLLLFPEGQIDADTFVLNVPLASDSQWLSLLVFLGGFSAATAMIVIATLSLSTMLSNDVLLPLLLKLRHQSVSEGKDLSLVLLQIRRIAIALIIFMAYGYHRIYAENAALTSIGLLAFSLVVQLAPAMLGGLYWKRGNAYGVYAGLLAGFALWFYTLMLPTLVRGGVSDSWVMEQGLFAISWLRPESLFGLNLGDPLSHGVILSLCFNIMAYIVVSRMTQTRLIDRLQAAAFVELTDPRRDSSDVGFRRQHITVSDLRALLERFAGAARANRLIADFEAVHQVKLVDSATPKLNLIRYVERVLSGIIGSSSARSMVHSVLSGRQLGIEEVVTFFDETTQAIQFNQKLISTTLENIDQGVSVIDRDMRMVAWNRRYLEMYQYPEGFMRVGMPVEELVRYNAERGECGPGSVEDHVHRRLDHLRKGSPHRFIRVRTDGNVIEMKGNPLPGGGFVTTFNDITEHVKYQEALRKAKEELEQRVEERTHTIQAINAELRAEIVHREEVEGELISAKAEAESANASKTRFLALASHDILQPLNAARLYTATLLEDSSQHIPEQGRSKVIHKLNESLQSTEELISTLLEIARIDDGAMQPKSEDFSLSEIMRPLYDEFDIIAQEKHLVLHWIHNTLRVHSDPVYLRRIVQNLVSNALKYTPKGKVLVGCRRHNDHIDIQVWDTGPGIKPEDREKIFNDFYRVKDQQAMAEGVGLGLGVVSRLSSLLHHDLKMDSWEGKGSMFQVSVPLAKAISPTATIIQPWQNPTQQSLQHLNVLCVDNQQENLEALKTLLAKWGCNITTATNRDQAMQARTPDIMIMDYQLDHGDNGIDLTRSLRQHWLMAVPAILITADADPSIRQLAASADMSYLRKPLKPAPLRSLLTSLISRKAQKAAM